MRFLRMRRRRETLRLALHRSSISSTGPNGFLPIWDGAPGILLGSTMTIDTDADRGQRVGSRLSLRGRVLGIPLEVNAVIVAREPPTRKVWETIGDPHLLVIGPYRMRVTIADRGRESRVTVGIDYALSPRWPDRWLGRMLGAAYARWCVRQMVRDLQRTFADR